MTRNLALLLFAVGWLSAVSARPYGHKQDADKQALTYLPYLSPFQQDQNTNEQGFRFTYPQTQSTTAEKEGSISFDWVNQQNMPQAEEEGFRFNYQIPFAKQQILRYPYYYGHRPFARKSGFSISLPQQQAFDQGIRYTWPQKQESSEKQSYRFQWPQQQGFTVRSPQETAKKEGFNVGWNQGYTFHLPQETAKKEGINVGWNQGYTFSLPQETAKKEGITIGWDQGQGQSQTGEEQRIVYHWPQSKKENAKEEGITFTYPQKQTSTAEKEGFSISFPQKEQDTAEAQNTMNGFPGITVNWPQQLQEVTKEDLSEIIEKLLAEQE